jgi:glycosyltransferase involved in cell wall biosynthesis
MTERNKYHTFKADEIPCQEISDPAVLSKNPMVSVKMITYNHEFYIAQAIEGVLMQETDFSIELIIGEDCSTDRTREIALDYQKKYPDIIRVLTSEKNVGMHKNARRTEKACRGKYIAFCEGDDYWHHPLKLQKQVDYLEAHPECGLVHSAADILIQKENKLIKWDKNNFRKIPHGYIFEDLLVFNFIKTLTACVRRDLVLDYLKKYKPQEKKWMMGDRPLWMEISKHYKIGYIPESLGIRRVLQNSAQHSPNIEYKMNFVKSSYDVRFFFIEKYGCSAITKKTVLNDFYNYMLYYSFRLGDIQQANNAYDYLVNNSGKIDKKVYLYHWGTKNCFRQFLVRAYYKVKREFMDLVNKQNLIVRM